MSENISGFGSKIELQASKTFPTGLTLTQFPDDSDGYDVETMQISDKAMGLNGDLISWSTANPITISISVIPQSEDDKNLSVLFEANRVGRGKLSANDIITLTIFSPNGDIQTYTQGVITDGMPGNSVASEGRHKTKTYMFAFENKIGN